MSGSELYSHISWAKYYQEEKLGVSSVIAMEQSRLYSEDGFGFAAALPTSLLLASSTLLRTVVDPGREGQDIIITSVRDSTLSMVSELLRTGLIKNIGTEATVNEVQDLMDMLGISGNLDVMRNKVVPVPVSIKNQGENKLKEGGALGRDHTSSIGPDFSEVLEASTSENEDCIDFSKKVKESRKNYKLEKFKTAVDNSVRNSENGPNLRKRSPRELILRSGSTNRLNKRMKLSSRDETTKTGLLSEKKISAIKFSLPRKNNHEDKPILDILEVPSDSEDEDVEKNNNDRQEVNDDGKPDHQHLERNQSVEGRLPKEGICGGDYSLERKTDECSVEHPSADILPSDSLWEGSKEEFLSMFGLCTLAQAEQIRARTTVVSAGRSRIRLRRSRKGRSVK